MHTRICLRSTICICYNCHIYSASFIKIYRSLLQSPFVVVFSANICSVISRHFFPIVQSKELWTTTSPTEPNIVFLFYMRHKQSDKTWKYETKRNIWLMMHVAYLLDLVIISSSSSKFRYCNGGFDAEASGQHNFSPAMRVLDCTPPILALVTPLFDSRFLSSFIQDFSADFIQDFLQNYSPDFSPAKPWENCTVS